MERSSRPTPEEIIATIGCGDAADIDQYLLNTADAEFNKEESDGPQDLQRAFNCLRAILMRHWENPAREVQKYVAGALMRRAQMFAHANAIDDARNDFSEVRSRYAEFEDIEVRRPVAAAFLEAGSLEERERDSDAALEWYEQGIEIFNNDQDALIEQQLVEMKINLAQIYVSRDWLDLAFEIVNDSARRWADSKIYWMRRKVAFLKVVQATAAAKNADHKTAALSLLPEAINYADRALGHFLHFVQGIAYEKWVRLLHERDHYDKAVLIADRFIVLAAEIMPTQSIDNNATEQIEEHLRNVHFYRAQSLVLLGRLDEALQACDLTGISSGDGEYTSADDKELAIAVLAVRAIILSKLRQFPAAKRCLFEIYRVAGTNVDETWTSAMVTSVGVAIENLESELKKVGLNLDEVTTPADGSPDPS